MSSSPRPGGRSARVRADVLGAALDLLDLGLEHVTIPNIAERSGVAPSSIYRRWGSRESVLIDALLAHSLETIPVPDSGSVREDMVLFATALARYLATPRVAGLLRALATVEQTAEFAALRDRFWTERFNLAVTMISRGVERGELARDTDPRLLLEALIAPLHFRRLLTGADPAADVVPLVDLLLNGTRRPR